MSRMNADSISNAKQAAGYAAAQLVEDGMLVGLGTGSTAAYFIASLIERCKRGLRIKAIASSKKSMEQALSGGIALIDMDNVTSIDLTVDGADEIDPQKRMIKGGGGAFVREKILASTSKEMVVIIDETKQVSALGNVPLPVEIIPFGCHATIEKLQKLDYDGHLRGDRVPFLTENGNYIFDIHFNELLKNPEEHHMRIISIPGVIDTGFFFNMAGRVITGSANGTVKSSDKIE